MPGVCWRSRFTAPAAKATRSPYCAGRERSWSNSWGSIPAQGCAAWRQTSSTTPSTSAPLRDREAAGGPEAARQAEEIARGLDDPALLAFALNGVFMQTFDRAGLAPRRDEIGAELVGLSARHGLVTFEVLGHLIRLQARSALADFATGDQHAAAADRLAERHDRPLVGVFTQWYRALRLAATGPSPQAAEAAYRNAAAQLANAGMPGVERGLLPLALLCLRVWHGDPVPVDDDTDWGPHTPS